MRINLVRSLLLALAVLTVSAASSAQVLVSVNFAPPPLPVYQQPLCPGEDYLWTPGYWAWSPAGYYWVPGTWVLAPEPGLLWTPGYWAFGSGLYYWHPGYWGPVVGYYGGIAYGFGYPGTGYYGGYWRDRHFFYNETVNNVNITRTRYVYRAAMAEPRAMNRVSFNGGPGGTRARPTPEKEPAAWGRHAAPTTAQMENERAASKNRQLLASVNAGRPPVAATAKPAELNGHGVAASRAGAPYKAPENRAAPSRPSAAAPVPERRPGNRPAGSQTELGRNSAPRPEAPRPPSGFRREVVPAPERAPHAERQFHPQNAPPRERPNMEARSQNREQHPERRAPNGEDRHR